ncbi:hypothetical protein D9M73_182940 [compost metagenome]
MQIQYLPTAVTRRAKRACCESSGWSSARPMRMLRASAASLSRARSANTFCINGCSLSNRPPTRRCAQWCAAWVKAWRINALEPTMQSKRVMATISMMVGTPRPSSPTIQATAPRNSTPLEAFDQLPSLFFRRWT